MPSYARPGRRQSQRSTTYQPARKVLAALVVAGSTWMVAGSADASAAVYRVSPSGSDAVSGSTGEPFRTISKAAEVARAGDTVLVASGRYAESIPLTYRSRGVTFRGEGGSRPVVDGEHERQYGFLNHTAGDVTIENFEVTGQTAAGIYMGGSGNRIADNLIHHVGSVDVTHSNGVRIVQGRGSVVQDNTIHSIGPGSESMGIWLVQTRDADVAGNTVYLVRKEGVRDWMGLDNTIRNNRFFLNWVGVSFNTSLGSLATNNYIYDNVQGFVAKHTAYRWALDYWKLTTPRWSRFWHNTIYRSTEANIWIAQSDQPADYLDIRNNILANAGASHVRDAPQLRGPHVIVDGNAYGYPTADQRPRWVYKAGWSSAAGLSDWNAYQDQTGWETNGTLMGDPQLIDPAAGNLDYPPTSPAAAGSLELDSPLGSQLGARGLPPTPARWTPYPMQAIDSSSKGTWFTKNHLGASADDNQFTYWLTATAADEFVTYDFGQRRTFDHLILSIFGHLDLRNPHGYRFEVSDDRVNWRTVLAGENPDTAGSSFKYELSQPATGRYLRYTMVDTSCKTYNPRTDCGAYFVLSDLKAGSVGSADDTSQAEPEPSPPPVTEPAPAPPPSQATPSPTPAPSQSAPESGPSQSADQSTSIPPTADSRRSAPSPAPAAAPDQPILRPAKLEVARSGVLADARALDVLAPLTGWASGRVEVDLYAAGRHTRFSAPVDSDARRVRFQRAIPRDQARLRTGILTLTYPGNENTRAQEVRLRAASRRAELRAERPALQAGHLRARGTIARRARGVVRVQLSWSTNGVGHSIELQARVGDGRWMLDQPLAEDVRRQIADRDGTVHSYTLFTGYLPARMRGEMKAYQVLGAP